MRKYLLAEPVALGDYGRSMIETRYNGSTMKGRRMNPYEFDVAISFAGENRALAEAITRELQRLGRNVFYDHDYKAHLWGKRQKEYERIYGKASRFFIPLVSKHYQRKDWTQLEFSIAKRALRNRSDEYILPVQIDKTILLGIPDDVGYLTSRENTPRQIAEAIDQKCRAAEPSRGSVPPRERRTLINQEHALSLLTTTARRTYLLLASSTLFCSHQALTKIFPSVDWNTSTAALEKAGLIIEANGQYTIARTAVDQLRRDTDEWTSAHKEWISALEPARSHLDVCVCLSLHYWTVGRADDAVKLLADAIEFGELGRWTDLYLTGLKAFSDPRCKRQLKPQSWLRALNGIGICLAHLERYGEAIEAFMRLKREATKLDEPHWTGQAYLNLGVAAAQAGNHKQARSWYEKAQCHGEQHNDSILVARALGNQSQLFVKSDPRRAKQLIDQSIEIKLKSKQRDGLATAAVQLGELAFALGNFSEAIKHYKSALSELESIGMYHDCAAVNLYLGNAYLELQKPAKALTAFRRAKSIAREWGFIDLEATAIGLESRALYDQSKHGEMRKACLELVDLSKKHHLHESHLVAQHGLGIAEIISGDLKSGRRTLSRAIGDAKRLGNRSWIERCTVDRCRQVKDGRPTEPIKSLLRKAAEGLENEKLWASAGDCWARLGNSFHKSRRFNDEIEAQRRAASCFGKARDHESKVFAIARVADAQWELRLFGDHFRSWQLAEDVAQNANLEELRARVLGQRAISHQDMGQLADAINYGTQAIKIDRKRRNFKHLATLLHNLGEGLRRSGRHNNAIEMLNEAEALALSFNNQELAISAAHNCALAYHDLNNYAEASRRFQRCRNESKKHDLWDEYVRAWEAMANLAYCERKVKLAATRYRRALAEAKRHHCTEQALTVALNYANLLWWDGKPRKAIQMLDAYCGEYVGRPDAYMYYFLYACASESISDLKAAEVRWKGGLDSAQSVGNAEFIAICAAGLAELYAGQKQYEFAEKNFRLALDHEKDPEDRAILLRQLTEVLLAVKKHKAASKAFHEGTTIAVEHKLDDVFIDLYMTIFDYNWRDGPKSRLESLKAFVCAFSRAIQNGPDHLLSVVGHVVRTITTKNLAPTQDELKHLHDGLSAWLRNEVPRQKWIYECLLFPLSIAERMLPHVGDPTKLGAAATKEFSNFGELVVESLNCSKR